MNDTKSKNCNEGLMNKVTILVVLLHTFQAPLTRRSVILVASDQIVEGCQDHQNLMEQNSII